MYLRSCGDVRGPWPDARGPSCLPEAREGAGSALRGPVSIRRIGRYSTRGCRTRRHTAARASVLRRRRCCASLGAMRRVGLYVRWADATMGDGQSSVLTLIGEFARRPMRLGRLARGGLVPPVSKPGAAAAGGQTLWLQGRSRAAARRFPRRRAATRAHNPRPDAAHKIKQVRDWSRDEIRSGRCNRTDVDVEANRVATSGCTSRSDAPAQFCIAQPEVNGVSMSAVPLHARPSPAGRQWPVARELT
jgi:hypothetical protein